MADIVKEKLPEVHNIAVRLKPNVNWEEINEDLSELQYLVTSEFQVISIGLAIWKICDKWITSELGLVPRYNILKFIKVKMALSSYISKISDKNIAKSLSALCMEKSQTLEFLSRAKVQLDNCSSDTFTKIALRIYELHSELKKILVSVFMHFEKYIKSEFSMNLSEILDQSFYEIVAFPHKAQLNQDPDTKKMIVELEKFQKSKTSSDDSVTPSNTFSYKGVNKYEGELDEEGKRKGYGKIVYYGGDSYEGYWENSKRHGKGLYIYKFGGRYLGEFKEDLPCGNGCKVYISGNFYVGEFFQGKKQGNGKMMFKHGDTFEGHWDNDDMHGHGKYVWTSGDYFEGKFVRDKREGNGILYLTTGETIEGVWKQGVLLDKVT